MSSSEGSIGSSSSGAMEAAFLFAAMSARFEAHVFWRDMGEVKVEATEGGGGLRPKGRVGATSKRLRRASLVRGLVSRRCLAHWRSKAKAKVIRVLRVGVGQSGCWMPIAALFVWRVGAKAQASASRHSRCNFLRSLHRHFTIIDAPTNATHRDCTNKTRNIADLIASPIPHSRMIRG